MNSNYWKLYWSFKYEDNDNDRNVTNFMLQVPSDLLTVFFDTTEYDV